jgi:CRISPR/Cas system Type II protein with McrA/HNH and RuvC-like nuclease domain
LIPRIETNPITFGYTTTISKLFKEGKLPEVVKGFYGGELNLDAKSLQRASNEHLKPKSLGGQTNLSNIVLATVENNAKRGNDLLSNYFNKEKADEYWKQFENLIVEYQKGNKTKIFDGNHYIEQSKATVKKILTQEKRLDLWG